MNLRINENLFAAWCGLLVSGYDLYDKCDKEILYLTAEIKSKLCDDGIARHFAFSKTNLVACNPYYPRASNLSVYCFYMNKPTEEYYAFLEYCGDTEYRNPEFQAWIEKSKYYIHSIIENQCFSDLFDAYCNIINKQFTGIDQQIQAVKDKLDKHNLLTDIVILFAPNLLQSKYLADYVLVENNLYVIAADFSEKTVIHEYLHMIAKSKQKEFEKILQEKNIHDIVNVNELQQLGYLKNNSFECKIHAMEEQFVIYYTNLLT